MLILRRFGKNDRVGFWEVVGFCAAQDGLAAVRLELGRLLDLGPSLTHSGKNDRLVFWEVVGVCAAHVRFCGGAVWSWGCYRPFGDDSDAATFPFWRN